MNIIAKIKDWFIKREVTKMLEKLKNLGAGYGTIGTQIVAIIVTLAALLWGPIQIGSFEIPKIDIDSAAKILWAAVTALFLRRAVSNNGQPPVA